MQGSVSEVRPETTRVCHRMLELVGRRFFVDIFLVLLSCTSFVDSGAFAEKCLRRTNGKGEDLKQAVGWPKQTLDQIARAISARPRDVVEML
jgi:hypothetical protein